MKRILFIAYHFDPFPGVGSKRISYWARGITAYGYEPIVITATENPSGIEGGKVIHVADPGNASGIIKDQGRSWYPALKEAIVGLETEVDATIITGGPFMHMKIAGDCRSILKSKVYLDFRDPFAINPRFNQPGLKVWTKKKLEGSYCKEADGVITVSQYCADLINTGNTPVHIIDNGYDERNMPEVQEVDSGAFVYAGSFYEDRDPSPLLDALVKRDEEVSFRHVGQPYAPNEKYHGWSRFTEHGLLPYDEAMQYVASAEVATMIVSGDPFESTTKVFDYMALNKKILVVSNKPLASGALTEILDDYPNKVICENAPVSIRAGLDEVLKMEPEPYDSAKWSRAAGLKALINLLKSDG